MPQSSTSFCTFLLVKEDTSLATGAFGYLVIAFPSFCNFFMEGHFLQLDLSHPHGFLWLPLVRNNFFLCISGLKFYVCTSDVIHGILFSAKKRSVCTERESETKKGKRDMDRLTPWIQSFLHLASLMLFCILIMSPTFFLC